MNESTLIQPLREFRIEPEFVGEVLKPYRPNCRYLKSAKAVFEGEPSWETLTTEGEFGIGESCYIDDTGHFNAVEFVLCFNQLAYCAFAPAVLNGEIAALRGWSIEDYFNYQLPSMLIKTTASRFKRQINASKFSARLSCKDFEVVERSLRYLKIPCAIEFWDEQGGSASGEVELAALNIP